MALRKQFNWNTERYDHVIEKIDSMVARDENHAKIADVEIDADNYANVSVPDLDDEFCISFPVGVEVSVGLR